MDTFTKTCKENIVWILCTIFALGVFYQVCQANVADVNSLRTDIGKQRDRIERIEIVAVKLDNLAVSMNEVRLDVKEIKKDLKDHELRTK